MNDRAEIPLAGGRANVGGVVRVGDEVARPAHPQVDSVEDFLRYLADQGVGFVPEVRDRDELGRQRLGFIEGEVPIPPYADWAFDEDLLVDVAEHQRRLHVAAADYRQPADATWAVTAGDYFPAEARHGLVTHNDLCMSNVVVDPTTRRVQGFIDFDYVAPAGRLFDIAVAARHWTPFDSPDGSELVDLDRVGRFDRFCDVHGLDSDERDRVVGLAVDFLDLARVNVRSLADAGGAGFIALIEAGYEPANQATVDWLKANRNRLVTRPGS